MTTTNYLIYDNYILCKQKRIFLKYSSLKSLTCIIIAIIFTPSIAQDSIKQVIEDENCRRVASHSYIHAPEESFCDETIVFNSDSTFLYLRGCEGHINMKAGFWSFESDSIIFRYDSINKIALICEIQPKGRISKNLKTTFFIADKTGRPVENFMIRLDKHHDSNSANNKQDYSTIHRTGKDGLLTLELSSADSFELTQFNVWTGRNFHYPTLNLTDTVRITVGINACAFFYPHTTFESGSRIVKWHFNVINANQILIEGKTFSESEYSD